MRHVLQDPAWIRSAIRRIFLQILLTVPRFFNAGNLLLCWQTDLRSELPRGLFPPEEPRAKIFRRLLDLNHPLIGQRTWSLEIACSSHPRGVSEPFPLLLRWPPSRRADEAPAAGEVAPKSAALPSKAACFMQS